MTGSGWEQRGDAVYGSGREEMVKRQGTGVGGFVAWRRHGKPHLGIVDERR